MSTPPIVEARQLGEALRKSGALQRGRVVDVTVEKSTPTILSHIFRLRPTYDGAGLGAPQTLILKAGLVDRPGGPWMGGRNEVAFYTDIAAAMPPGLVPRCFDAHFDAGTGTWHLLLEDLTDSHMVTTQWPLPPTLGHCEQIVRTLARFQAAWWDDPRLGTAIGVWQDTGATDQALKNLGDQFKRFADDLGDRLSEKQRDLYARLFNAAPRLIERYHTRRNMTIVHGDAHVWNYFLPKTPALDSARLFDWDAWRPDVGTDDLAYMMALHWFPDLRQRNEQHLLNCFHDELLARGVRDYDRKALQDDYRLSVLWQITTPVWQHAYKIPPSIWWNHLARIHLAVDDLGCHALLDG